MPIPTPTRTYHREDVGEDVGVRIGVVECQLNDAVSISTWRHTDATFDAVVGDTGYLHRVNWTRIGWGVNPLARFIRHYELGLYTTHLNSAKLK